MTIDRREGAKDKVNTNIFHMFNVCVLKKYIYMHAYIYVYIVIN